MTSSQFITVKEGAKIADVFDKTIRRWLRQFVEDPKHEHSDKILPDAKAYEALRKKKRTAAWKINADFFRREKGIDESGPHDSENGSSPELVTILREQLKAKDDQIGRLQTSLDQSQKLHLSTQQAAGMLPEPDKDPSAQVVAKKRGLFGLFSR